MDSKPNFGKFILYSYWRSSCSWRVRIVLNMKKIKYEQIHIHLLKEGGQQFTEEYTKLNPAQRVPLLVFEDLTTKKIHSIAESSAICEFLEETYPEETSLLSKDLVVRAKIRQIYNEIACNIQPIQNLCVLQVLEKDYKGVKTEWAHNWIKWGLEEVEQILVSSRGKFCVGDSVSFADVYLVPQLYNARRFKVDLSGFKNILEIEKNVSEIEEFKNAIPENQPDAEK